MSRIQLALNVDDVAAATAFYAALFGTEPAKTRPGYANFAVTNPPLKLVLIENPGLGGTLNHLGVEVESTEVVEAEQRRLAGRGLASVDERGTTCCYATQDKFWVQGTPGGERWEVYTVLADSEAFGSQPGDGCSCGTAAADAPATAEATACCGATAVTDPRAAGVPSNAAPRPVRRRR